MKIVHKHIYWKEIDGVKVPYVLQVTNKDKNNVIVSTHPEGMPDPFAEAPNLSRAKVEQDLKKKWKNLNMKDSMCFPVSENR